jgi:hypothetical protein
MDKERCAGEAGSTVLTWHLQRRRLGGRLGVINGRSIEGGNRVGPPTGRVQACYRGRRPPRRQRAEGWSNESTKLRVSGGSGGDKKVIEEV